MQRVAVLAGRHGGGPGVPQIQPHDLRFEARRRRVTRRAGSRERSGRRLQEPAAIHRILRMATSSAAQCGFASSSMRTMGVS